LTRKYKSSETLIPVITFFSDVIAIFLSVLFSYWLRFYSPVTLYLPIEKGIGIAPIHWYLILALIIIPFWIIIFQSRKMYRPRRVVFIFDEFFVITRLVTFGVIFSFGLIFFYREFPYSRIVFLMIWFFAIIFITVGRYFVLKIEKSLYSKGKALKKTIVIGSNESAMEIYNNFIHHKYAGYEIIGYIKNENEKAMGNEQVFQLLGNYSQINEIINKNEIETCIVTLPSSQNETLYNIMKSCEGINV
jgi:FlaA1/EpsC-like NDP-sugar epimerase